jgi:hypothetical protein
MGLRRMARRLARYLLPEAVLYPLWRWQAARSPRSALPTASDHRTIAIQDGMRLDVFWVDRTLGPGPGASLYVLGDEVLRLDCFGAEGLGGHYHINPRQVELSSGVAARLFFPAGSHEDHIERAAFELETNLPAILAMNRDARIRRIEVDEARLTAAAAELRHVMSALLQRHRADLELGGRVAAGIEAVDEPGAAGAALVDPPEKHHRR